MEMVLAWVEGMLEGLQGVALNPFTYLVLIIMILLWRQQVQLQRKLFGTRLQTVTEGMLHSLFVGLLAGIILSTVVLSLGLVLTIETVLLLWTVSFLLSFIHIRYLRFAFAASIIGGLVLIARQFPQGWPVEGFDVLWNLLVDINLVSLMMLVAVIQLLEAVLIYRFGGRKSTPLLAPGKRGRIVGGYQMNHIWFMPLFILVPAADTGMVPLYEGWPVLAGDFLTVSLLCIPALTGFYDWTTSSLPVAKARAFAKRSMAYSLILLVFSVGAYYVPAFVLVAIVFAFGGYEVLYRWSKKYEQQRSPYLVHESRGIRIFAIVPYTPAEEMGLQPGEIMTKVNGQAVRKSKDVYRALALNKAFCQLEVLNLEGEKRFVKRSLYEHEHHQLGLIFAPDADEQRYVRLRWHLVNIIAQVTQVKKISRDRTYTEGSTSAPEHSPPALEDEKRAL